ncbi:aminopeptidase N-like [Ceratina calcarata]|uniref:Aminopeptidase N-like n=1 Tax=Ceratina calcarata TaxID=156304 RepID=A0AAJ7J6E2_9HYME|nr:aminopeptidase N-like [Ceratina calcarata]
MRNWTETPGYPVVTVKKVKQGYQLTQEGFAIDSEDTKWWIPITYTGESHPDFNDTLSYDWIPPNEEPFILNNSETKGWVVFNIQQVGYYRVNYEIENWKLLIKELNKGNNTKIHPVNRAQIVDDTFSLARAERLNYTVAFDVSLFLTHEADYIPWQSAFRHLGFLQNLLRTSKNYYIFRRYVAYLMKTLTKNVGYEPKANDSDLVKMLRVDTIKWACEAGVKECTFYAKKTYQQWIENPLKKKASRNEWFDTLEYIITSNLDEDDKKDLLMALACSNSSEILMTYLTLTFEPGYPIDFKTGVKNVLSKYPAGVELVSKFLSKEDKRIRPNLYPKMIRIAEALGRTITNEQQFLNLSKFCHNNKLMQQLEIATRKATANLIWINKYKSTVDKWLSANSRLFKSSDSGGNIASSMVTASVSHCSSFDCTKEEL